MRRIVTGRRMVTPTGVAPGSLVIDDGRIIARLTADEAPPDLPCLDAGDAVVMPGVVDIHVHVNEPGRTEWEGFATAGRAAAAGGVTTLIDMPLNSEPVTVTPAALDVKANAAAAACRVDYGFWGGLVPAHAAGLDGLLDAGVLGIKCFLVDSGLDAFPPVGVDLLRSAMIRLAARDLPLLVHAEWPAALEAPPVSTRSHAEWAASRPAASEVAAVEVLIDLVAETGCAVHVVHLAAPEALPALAAARDRGLPITVETCPHYLTFVGDEVPDGATLYKCAPPLRDRSARAGLWRGLAAGVIDLVATDHSPCPPADKRLASGDFVAAWGGIASLQLLLPALWTEARLRGFGLPDLARWLCTAPAQRAGLGDRKGVLDVGYDADIVIWHPEQDFHVDAARLFHRHPQTPYEGRRLTGVVTRTLVRGRTVYDGTVRDGTAHDHDAFPADVRGRWQRPAPAQGMGVTAR